MNDAIKSGFTCPYCQSDSRLVGGDVVYPHRGDLRQKRFWHCAPCKAWVGCHPGTTTPLGQLANATLRSAKSMAHAAFDPIWKDGHKKREAAYRWLANELGIPRADCHMGMMDVEMCKRVAVICQAYLETT